MTESPGWSVCARRRRRSRRDRVAVLRRAPPSWVALGAAPIATVSGWIVAVGCVARAERHDLDLVAAAEVAERGRLHLVDRGLVRRRVGRDLLLAPLREVRVAVRLQVVRQADARVRHDRGAGAGLDRGGRVAVAAGAVELVAVERVVAAELVAHLVGHVVDGVEVTRPASGCPCSPGLVRAADDAEVRDAAARLRRARGGRCRSSTRR